MGCTCVLTNHWAGQSAKSDFHWLPSRQAVFIYIGTRIGRLKTWSKKSTFWWLYRTGSNTGKLFVVFIQKLYTCIINRIYLNISQITNACIKSFDFPPVLLRPFKRHKKDIKIKYWYTFPQWAWIERPDLNIAPGNASHTQVDGTKTFFKWKEK